MNDCYYDFNEGFRPLTTRGMRGFPANTFPQDVVMRVIHWEDNKQIFQYLKRNTDNSYSWDISAN